MTRCTTCACVAAAGIPGSSVFLHIMRAGQRYNTAIVRSSDGQWPANVPMPGQGSAPPQAPQYPPQYPQQPATQPQYPQYPQQPAGGAQPGYPPAQQNYQQQPSQYYPPRN